MKVKNIISWIIMIEIIIMAFNFYKNNNFGEYTKSETELKT